MSTSRFHLPALASSGIQARSIPAIAERLEIWAFAALLLSGLGVVCLNQVWITCTWQSSLFLLTAVVAARSSRVLAWVLALPVMASSCIPLLGIAQILFHRTAYGYNTLLQITSWLVVPACMFMGMDLLRANPERTAFFRVLSGVAAATTMLELYQLFLYGRYRVTFSGLPLISSNFYAEFTELLLPVVLATSLRKGGNLWRGCGLAAFMAGTTIASGARMGSVLIFLEIVCVLFFTHSAKGYLKLSWKQHVLPMLAMLAIAISLEGFSTLTQRLFRDHLFNGRYEVAASTRSMIAAHPVVGFGLGSFSIVYPQFSHAESAYFVNHAHNDYLELTAESGVLGLGFWVLALALTLPSVARAPWAFGVFAIIVHSFTDFPLYRLPVVALFAILLAAARSRSFEDALRVSAKLQDDKYDER